jgi:hypothetical protein
MSKFTIETALKLTTALKILSCSMHQNISKDIGNLSPECEPVVMARKPLSEKTIAANVLRWGTGAINVDGTRIPGTKPQVTQGINSNATSFCVAKERQLSDPSHIGRWPSNLIHDGSDEVVEMFPDALGRAAQHESYQIYGGNAFNESVTQTSRYR